MPHTQRSIQELTAMAYKLFNGAFDVIVNSYDDHIRVIADHYTPIRSQQIEEFAMRTGTIFHRQDKFPGSSALYFRKVRK